MPVTSSSRTPSGAAVRRPEVTDAIRAAVVALLAEEGYERTSMEGVARRAGVGKAAIYRRWSSKAALVADVISAFVVRPQDIPDTGSLRGDVLGLVSTWHAWLTENHVRRIMPDVLAAAIREPQLDAALNQLVAGPRRALARAVLERAILRDELPGSLDAEIALDLLPGPLYWRLSVRRRSMTANELEKLVDALVAGLRGLGG